MAKKTFKCAVVEPSILVPLDHDLGAQPNLLVTVFEAAPNGANRDLLRSRIFEQGDTPYASFNAFGVAHDITLTRDAYADIADGQDDEDMLHPVVLIERRSFDVYESRRTEALYYLAPEAYLTKIFKRYRETTQNFGATFRRRRVRLAELDQHVPEVDINGFDFEGVP